VWPTIQLLQAAAPSWWGVTTLPNHTKCLGYTVYWSAGNYNVTSRQDDAD
jgi:hypothetical protein